MRNGAPAFPAAVPTTAGGAWRVAGRVLLVALGAVGALLGLALAAAGVVLLVLTGRDTSFGGAEAALSTDRYALVTEAAGLGGGGLDATVRVRVRSNQGGPVFVGVAPAADVDRYLAGTAYDELRRRPAVAAAGHAGAQRRDPGAGRTGPPVPAGRSARPGPASRPSTCRSATAGSGW